LILRQRNLSTFALVHKAPHVLQSRASIGTGTLQRLNTMSRDVTHFSDISKSKTEADGSFKRAASSFRNFIQAGGQFPPEKGTSSLELCLGPAPRTLSWILQIAIIFTYPMRAVRPLVPLCMH